MMEMIDAVNGFALKPNWKPGTAATMPSPSSHVWTPQPPTHILPMMITAMNAKNATR